MTQTNIILLAIFFELAIIGYGISKQIQAQHFQLMQLIDSLAEMVGEAIDKEREDQ